MTDDQMWNCEEPITDRPDWDIEIPDWIDQRVTPNDVAAIQQGGCASGAYMPAVTYHTASQTMAEHGDDVLDYIEEALGELPAVPDGTSWSGMACHYLSVAVELWAGDAYARLEDVELELDAVLARKNVIANTPLYELYHSEASTRPDTEERINCPLVGKDGHRQCGICSTHQTPRIDCGCLAVAFADTEDN